MESQLAFELFSQRVFEPLRVDVWDSERSPAMAWYDDVFDFGIGLLDDANDPYNVSINPIQTVFQPTRVVSSILPAAQSTQVIGTVTDAFWGRVKALFQAYMQQNRSYLQGMTLNTMSWIFPFLRSAGIISAEMATTAALDKAISWWIGQGKPVRRRRKSINPLNPRALKRSTRRLSMFSKISKDVNRELAKLAPPRRSTGRRQYGGGCNACGQRPCSC